MTTDFLYDYQLDAVRRLKNGSILCGGVGSGKSRTGLFYYFKENGGWVTQSLYYPMDRPKNLYIITTAKKRDSKEWDSELANFQLSTDGCERYPGLTIVVDSWNNIKKYADITDSFFLFDEQRVVGYGAWTKAFLKIAQGNKWILLTATPGDTYLDYLPVFLANGFFRNKTEFTRSHCVYSRYTKYPKIDRYINTSLLDRYRNTVLVRMNYHHDINVHHEDVYCTYDISIYKRVMKDRWDVYKEEPITQASGLCYTLRRVVNSDPSRVEQLLALVQNFPKIIVFYNFNYERDILKHIPYPDGTVVAEWSGNAHEDIPDSERWVYLVQYNAGSEGWNCITTNVIVFWSQNYSYKMTTQAAGRIDRLNTPFQDLYYYHFKSRSAIDLSIAKALQQKRTFNENKFVGAW